MVSVIIPNYNHAIYLEQRIQSVLEQTFRNFEIIILDDCSSDNSLEIINKYRSHEKVAAVVINETNSGSTFKQWIRGIEISKSEFVWIAESDDWCEPTFLENVLDGLSEDPECVVGFCQSVCIQGQNTIKWKSNYPYLYNSMPGAEFIKNHMLLNTAIFNASMAVWRRSAFSKVSTEFAKYGYCGDWLFWIELCMQGKVFISGKLLNYFRKHDGDVSGKAIQMGESFTEELTMFHLLYRRKWISFEDLFKALRNEYIHYNAVKGGFTAERNTQIKKLFFEEPGMRVRLQMHYRLFYTRYAAKKLLNGLLGRTAY